MDKPMDAPSEAAACVKKPGDTSPCVAVSVDTMTIEVTDEEEIYEISTEDVAEKLSATTEQINKSNTTIAETEMKPTDDVKTVEESKLNDETEENKERESSTEPESKEQKTLSREMKSLINSAKDSKIISEFTQITSKMRKPRKELDLSGAGASANTSLDVEGVAGSRRSSDNSLISNSSDISDKTGRRSMRSLNPDFVQKQRKFLSTLTGKQPKEEAEVSHVSESESEDDCSTSHNRASEKSNKENAETDADILKKLNSDKYCWRCHWLIEDTPSGAKPPRCSVCPRSYHPKCVNSKTGNTDRADWVCPECMTILHAEAAETRSQAMQKTSLSTLCTLLNYALARMKLVSGVEEFLQPVDTALCPDYHEHVVHPMDLGRVQQNIVDGLYGSTEAFLADTMWILHNCLVYNSPVRSRLTVSARSLVRECRKEMGEIEACPECYASAHARKPTWFTDACTTPHILLWAKLKGFPFWPAKGMTVNEMGMVDVRFFGDHDRAWVPAKYCYLYSLKDPNNSNKQRVDIVESIKEAEQHIKSITKKFGSFIHAAYRTPFDPYRLGEQLKVMIPGYMGVLPAPRLLRETSSNTSTSSMKNKRLRSISKGSKDSIDGYATEEEIDVTHYDDNTSTNESARENSIEVDATTVNSPTPLRKRIKFEEATTFSVMVSNRKRTRNSSDDKSDERELPSKKENLEVGVVINEDISKEKPIKQQEKNESNENKSNKSSNKFEAVENEKNFDNEHKESPKKVSIDKHKEIDGKKPDDKNEDKYEKDRDKSNKIVVYTTAKNSINSDKTDTNQVASTPPYKLTQSPTKQNASTVKQNTPTSIQVTQSTKQYIPTLKQITPTTKQNTKSTVSPEKQKSKLSDSLFGTGDQMPTITSVRSLATELSPQIARTDKKNPDPNTNSTLMAEKDNNFFRRSKSGESSTNSKEVVSKPSQSVDKALKTPTSKKQISNVGAKIFVDVEIKSEPVDYDEVEKTAAKNDLLGSLNLRPTSSMEIESQVQKVSELRNVRRVTTPNKSGLARARKTFPQPQRKSPTVTTSDAITDLNGKNTMVYIPIQPPTTSAPTPTVRAKTFRPPNMQSTLAIHTASSPQQSITSSTSSINTITSPAPSVSVPASLPQSVISTPPTSSLLTSVSSSVVTPLSLPTSAPSTSLISNIPLLSSVNGQWTLCLPPLVNMDSSTATPMVNGVSENCNSPGESTNMTSRVPIITAVPTSTLLANTPREPPPLQARPGHPLDSNTPIGSLPVPSEAGPCTTLINQSAVKLADYFRTLLTDSLLVLDDPVATVASLRLQLEHITWKHKQELAELKHNTDVQVVEMRNTMEREKATAVAEARRVAEMELCAAVTHAKSKTWCANCRQEAQFYCCWNTSYCDYPCQQAHWTQHFNVCTQTRNGDQPTEEPKTMKTVGGKTISRPFGSSGGGSGNSVLHSSVSPSSTPGLVMNVQNSKRSHFNQPAFIINNQLMSAEEPATTKMTPGGYLIVGGGSSGRPVVSNSNVTPSL